MHRTQVYSKQALSSYTGLLVTRMLQYRFTIVLLKLLMDVILPVSKFVQEGATRSKSL